MSSGARQLLQIAQETVNGVTPSPFNRATLPLQPFHWIKQHLKKHQTQSQIHA